MTKDEFKELFKTCLTMEDGDDKIVAISKANETIDTAFDEIDKLNSTNQNLTMRMSEMILQTGTEEKKDDVPVEVTPESILDIIENERNKDNG